MKKHIVVIADNLRSTHNVGSLLRTADGLGVESVYLTGYTPYPTEPDDVRLPHEALKITKQIHKTALGAENTMATKHITNVGEIIEQLRMQGYTIVALEQAANATMLHNFTVPERLALLLGREVEGIEAEVLALADETVQIPMFGHKESFNVVQAAAMALYHCRFAP